MNQVALSRRAILIGGSTAGCIAPGDPRARRWTGNPLMKDLNCGCCSAWIEILENDGFIVTTEPSLGTLLMRYKLDNGIPQEMVSCHTGRVEGYSDKDIEAIVWNLNTTPGKCLGVKTPIEAFASQLGVALEVRI